MPWRGSPVSGTRFPRSVGGRRGNQGVDALVVDPKTVQVDLANVDTYPGEDDELFADADNGIVAVDDGRTWAGTSGTGLPFP
jgi:hypothetical protein